MAFSKVIEAIVRKAVRQPARTSAIGYWKYMKIYGVLVHHAAALVIARRAMGHRERITKEIREKLRTIKRYCPKGLFPA